MPELREMDGLGNCKFQGVYVPHVPNKVGQEIARILAEQRRKREAEEKEESNAR